MCSKPLASARSVPGSGAAGAGWRRRRWPCAAGRRRCAGRRWPGRRRSTASPAASCPPGSRRPAGSAAGLGDVGERERQPAVDAERPVRRRCRRGHAEPAVVVDRRRPQRDPGELAERVGLLVGQPAAAEAPTPSRPYACWARPIPAATRSSASSQVAWRQRAGPVPGHGADQRGEQPLRVVEQVGGGPALGAQSTAVGREVVAAAGSPAGPPADHQDAALQRAVRAVGEGRGSAHRNIVGRTRYGGDRRTLRSFLVAHSTGGPL